VFCYRITSTTFGFMSAKDRADATLQLRPWAEAKGFNLRVTYYRDVSAEFASQISLWHCDGQPGGLSIHHGGVIKDCRYRNVITGKMA